MTEREMLWASLAWWEPDVGPAASGAPCSGKVRWKLAVKVGRQLWGVQWGHCSLWLFFQPIVCQCDSEISCWRSFYLCVTHLILTVNEWVSSGTASVLHSRHSQLYLQLHITQYLCEIIEFHNLLLKIAGCETQAVYCYYTDTTVSRQSHT